MSTPLEITEVLPWGRSLSEYAAMFSLTDADCERSILSCADGPASFNVEMLQPGHRVTSVDPVYRFTCDQIRERIAETREQILESMRANMDVYRWDSIPDVETLEEVRMTAMNRFLDDFESGKEEDRYIDGALPQLPFDDAQFELVLCSHCLFTYSAQLDEEFHVASVRELKRVGEEVRIFPLLDMNGTTSKHMGSVERALLDDGYYTERIRVDYEFQKGGNEMLVVREK